MQGCVQFQTIIHLQLRIQCRLTCLTFSAPCLEQEIIIWHQKIAWFGFWVDFISLFIDSYNKVTTTHIKSQCLSTALEFPMHNIKEKYGAISHGNIFQISQCNLLLPERPSLETRQRSEMQGTTDARTLSKTRGAGRSQRVRRHQEREWTCDNSGQLKTEEGSWSEMLSFPPEIPPNNTSSTSTFGWETSLKITSVSKGSAGTSPSHVVPKIGC